MSLIDKEELLTVIQSDIDVQIEGTKNMKNVMRCLQMILDDVKESPTVDAVPVRRGKWIDEGQHEDNFPHHAWRCSECGEHIIEINTPWFNYCPNCGTKMLS